MANRTVDPSQLGAALSQELTVYSKAVTEGMNKAGLKAVQKIAKETRSSAPVGDRGKFRSSITSGQVETHPCGNVYAWHVKAPELRLTHLLVHGHATKDGGRTRSDPFLHNAMAKVLPEYEAEIKKVLQNGK